MRAQQNGDCTKRVPERVDCPRFAGPGTTRAEHGAKEGQTRLARRLARWGQSPFRNNANELTSKSGPNGTLSLAYDAWGRMTSKSRGSNSASYEFRYGHYLTDASSNFPDEAGAAYLTGGDGKRRSATAGGSTVQSRWDAGYTVINEEDGSGNLERTFVGRNRAQNGDSPRARRLAWYIHDR